VQEFENFPPAKSRKRQALSSIAIIWIAPFLAFVITASMVINAYRNGGDDVFVTFNSGSNMEVGKTPVMYRGVQVGLVQAMNINPDDISHVDVTLRINKSAAKAVAKEGTKFWKVEPKVSLTEVSGLDTIVRGAYIAVMPAASTIEGLKALPYQDHFIGTTEKPIDVFDPGFAFMIKASSDTDIAIGAPILFKKQIVGKVESKELADDASYILYKARLQSQYKKFLHNESQFYTLNALDIKASLAGVDIKLSSLASLIAGGITFDTPIEAITANAPLERTTFTLYHDKQEANHADIALILHAKENYGLKEKSSKVYFNGIESGFIQSITYNPIEKNNEIKLILQKRCFAQINDKSYFWVVRPKLGFNQVEGLDTLLTGSYIAFSNEADTTIAFNHTQLHDTPPPLKGKRLILTATQSYALKVGTPILYKEMAIGEYEYGELINDGAFVKHHIVIYPNYTHLINKSSSFYLHAAIHANISTQGVNVDVGSLEQIARGGIVVETPDLKDKGEYQRYDLFANRSVMLESRYFHAKGLRVKVSAQDASALKRNQVILFKKLPIGKVETVHFNPDNKHFEATLFIESHYASLVRKSSKFYNASGIKADIDFKGLHLQTHSIASIINGGIALLTPKEAAPALENEHFFLFASKEAALLESFTITLHLHNAQGFKVGMPITYKGLTLGEISDITFDGLEPIATLKIEKRYRHFFTAKSEIYKESFSLSMEGIKNASSLISGGYLAITTPISAPPCNTFTLRKEPPLLHDEVAMPLVIFANKLSGVKRGTRITYHQYPIGVVQRTALSADASHIIIHALITQCYAPLIRTNSHIYSSSGVGVDLSLFGSKIRTESIESLLQGTLSVATPNNFTAPADSNTTFWLASEPKEEWLDYNASITLPCNQLM